MHPYSTVSFVHLRHRCKNLRAVEADAAFIDHYLVDEARVSATFSVVLRHVFSAAAVERDVTASLRLLVFGGDGGGKCREEDSDEHEEMHDDVEVVIGVVGLGELRYSSNTSRIGKCVKSMDVGQFYEDEYWGYDFLNTESKVIGGIVRSTGRLLRIHCASHVKTFIDDISTSHICRADRP